MTTCVWLTQHISLKLQDNPYEIPHYHPNHSKMTCMCKLDQALFSTTTNGTNDNGDYRKSIYALTNAAIILCTRFNGRL